MTFRMRQSRRRINPFEIATHGLEPLQGRQHNRLEDSSCLIADGVLATAALASLPGSVPTTFYS